MTSIFQKHLVQLIILASVFFYPHSIFGDNMGSAHSHRNHILKQRMHGLEERVEALLSQLTLAEKVSLLHSNGKFSISSVERLGIHELWMSDGPHGVREETDRVEWIPAGWNNDHATYLPPLISVAGSWDRDLARRHGEVLGSEARHRRKDIILGPGANMARLPINGRTFEYMGEDPTLVSTLVVPQIKGIQSKDVAACIKHYALNTQELNRRKWNATPDERTLREVYLPAFKAAVKEAGVYSVMGSYNFVYGEQACQSKILIDILKKEWGFDGVFMTDWNVLINDFDAPMNGLDLEMGTNAPNYDEFKLARPLREHILAGRIPMSILDNKVRRMLRLQLRIGMMDEYRMGGKRNVKEHHQTTYDIAAGSTVLLKNSVKVLPLNKKELKKVLVMGPNADKKHAYGGGSSFVKTLHEVTPLEGLRNTLGDDVELEIMSYNTGKSVEPIPGTYLTSRDPGAGIPAWEAVFYLDATRTKIKRSSWFADSAYRWVGTRQMNYFSLFGDIKPKVNGTHKLKFTGMGDIRLLINSKEVFKGKFKKVGKNEPMEVKHIDISLNANQVYSFELQYNGRYQFGMGWEAPDRPLCTRDEYISAAKSADAVIYFGGLSHVDDREGKDRPNLILPNQQDAVIEDLLAANKNTVIFLIGGSPAQMPWVDKANSILWGWYGGNNGGHAFADIIFGKVNPSGKLPITFPKSLKDSPQIALSDYNAKGSSFPEGVFIGHRWFEKMKIDPLFCFGHGLSYSTFSYDRIDIPTRFSKDSDAIELSLTVTNTSKRSGKEIVQLYLGDSKASVERPNKELKAFHKVELKAGESKRVSFTLNQRDLSFWDTESSAWIAEAGEFRVMIGSSVKDIRQTATFNFGI
ncbi:MAG: glycoside hydrolase family 3 C-terminal domain-containing protein [Planctomycetes bacterium]|nr:glycoside hydrolase family 3 C-terminal domain-containing protein [Planctomycetota bacterium]